MKRTWFVTGASGGIGRAVVDRAVAAGDHAICLVRDPGASELPAPGPNLTIIAGDVTDHDSVRMAVARAVDVTGRLDVVVNNAGAGMRGAVEETDMASMRLLLETNLLGPLAVVQAALPLMREQGHGHIVQMSSVGGVMAIPNASAYQASKWALEAMSESLAAEVKEFGIAVTIVEPGLVSTDWAQKMIRPTHELGEYDEMRKSVDARVATFGTVEAAEVAEAVFGAVESGTPPLRILVGHDMINALFTTYIGRLREWGVRGAAVDDGKKKEQENRHAE